MTKITTLEIRDEVNCRFIGVDPATRRRMVDALKFFLQFARHSPAYKMGRWDGYIRFCDVGGRTFVNLIDKVVPILYEAGYDIEIVDKRNYHEFEFHEVVEDEYSSYTWSNGEPIILRDYQVETINLALSNTQSLTELPTGGGKSIVTAALAKKVEKYGRTILIVPNNDLVTQSRDAYEKLGLDVGVFHGKKKELDKTHTVCTWQSLNVLTKKKKNKEGFEVAEALLNGLICVIVDEVHQSSASILRQLLTDTFSNIPIRWGLTGTIPKDEAQFTAIKASIGDVVQSIKAYELQEKDVLADLHITVLQMVDNIQFKDYHKEQDWLSSNEERLTYIAKEIKGFACDGNTLVLVDRVATGEILAELIEDSVFLYGHTKSEIRKEEYESIQTSNNKVIIATYGIAKQGIDIPRIFNLVLLEPGKSFIKVIQSIGRGIRRSDDKDFVNIYDVASNAKYSKRHLTERKALYKEARYNFTVKKVTYK